MQREAAANTYENFAAGFDMHFDKALIDRLSEAQEFTYAILSDSDMRADVKRCWCRWRTAGQGRQPGALPHRRPARPADEGSKHLEYKATLRTHADSGEVFKPLEAATIKTIAAFLNSDDGGTLLLGVDDGRPRGLAETSRRCTRTARTTATCSTSTSGRTLANAVGPAAATNVSVQMHVVGDHDVCPSTSDPAGPCRCHRDQRQEGQHLKEEHF